MNLFPKQYYLIGKNQEAKHQAGWEQSDFAAYTLFSAPDLKKYIYAKNNLKLVLLGFAFSILDASKTEADILQDMAEDFSNLHDHLDHLCGNFVLLVQKDDLLDIYHDAAAALKVFYHLNSSALATVASDPALLGLLVNLERDASARALEFYRHNFYKQSRIRLGPLTPYNKVFQLIPNHYLDLASGTAIRYFPGAPKEELTVQESIKRVHGYFENVFEAMSQRYKINCTLTAGWDSRIVASLTKKHKDEVQYFTLNNPPVGTAHPDIKIPLQITKQLGLQYKLIDRNTPIKQELAQNAVQSFELLNHDHIKTMYAGFAEFSDPADMVLVGSVSEICKNYYERVEVKNGRQLALAAHFPVMEYTVSFFQQKYEELKKLEDDFNYDLRDIAHWEQDITNFAGYGMFERSFVTTVFSPLNCRKIITTILATDHKYRDKQSHTYYKKYIEAYFPELNKFPVNPFLKRRMITFLKKIGIYRLYKPVSVLFRK